MLVQVQQKIMLHKYSMNTLTYCFLQNKKLFGLVVSFSKGWGIFSFKKDYFLLKENNCYSFLYHRKSQFTLLSIFFLGFQRGYFYYLKLKGIGYKFTMLKDNIIFKFGFSHRIVYINYIDVYCKFFTKYLLFLESRSLWVLKKLLYDFFNIRKKNAYKKKGIFLKGCLFSIKISSKKSKF